MQSEIWVDANSALLLAPGQEMILKFEIEVGADNWINLCDLDSKNYVESFSISLGGASPTPNPIGGKWSVTLFNEGGIFHPYHGGAYAGYCVTGRKIRITIGGTYAADPHIPWQRIIGYMEEPKFSAPDYRVNISGGDYMKLLEDAQFHELDNYWGDEKPFPSWPSTGLMGDEMYTLGDAMDTADTGAPGFENIHDDWDDTNCILDWLAEAGKYVGEVIVQAAPQPRIEHPDIGAHAGAGKKYRVRFRHLIVGGDGNLGLRIQISQAALIKQMLYFPTDEWAEETFYFVATNDDPIKLRFRFPAVAHVVWLDDISVLEYIPYEERIYELGGLDPLSKGPFHVTYDDGGGFDPVQQGEEDEGWYYAQIGDYVFFDLNKVVIDGTGPPPLDNVVIHYFTATSPEDAIARILYLAKVPNPTDGLPYADVDAAETAMAINLDPTGIIVDKIWFEEGSTFLDAIRMLCELTDHRFHFAWNGQPIFKDRPTVAVGADFAFTSPAHIASSKIYQSRSEIKNRIVIKGNKQAEPGNRDDTTPSELKGEEHNDVSIGSYGERTMTITNHLFQDQTELNQMCVDLLARNKDPKWYADLKIPFNPVPLELGDTIEWEERINHTTNVTKKGIIRDIKITKFKTTYKCEIE